MEDDFLMIVLFILIVIFCACCFPFVCRNLDKTDTNENLRRYFSQGERRYFCQRNDNKVMCYLCRVYVNDSHWNDGSHRKDCATRNRQLIQNWPKINSKCFRCFKRLIQWPKIGPHFYCDGTYCPLNGASIKNTGSNRFNCFICDFDLCLNCINRNHSRLRTEIRERSRSLTVDMPPEEPTIDYDIPNYRELTNSEEITKLILTDSMYQNANTSKESSITNYLPSYEEAIHM